jgi:hypothetical protein
MLFLGVAALSVIGSANDLVASTEAPVEMWAGHQVVFGETDVPVLGKKETRSDSYVLAKIRRLENRIEIDQTACKVAFKKVLGATVHIPEQALLKLPSARFSFIEEAGNMKAAPWQVGWNKQDVDHDGKPGLTVTVDSGLCGGNLYVASSTRSTASGKMLNDGMMGKISVRVKQKILDSDSICLKMFAADSDEIQNGGFVYRRVQDNASCESLLQQPWPITANVKR